MDYSAVSVKQEVPETDTTDRGFPDAPLTIDARSTGGSSGNQRSDAALCEFLMSEKRVMSGSGGGDDGADGSAPRAAKRPRSGGLGFSVPVGFLPQLHHVPLLSSSCELKDEAEVETPEPLAWRPPEIDAGNNGCEVSVAVERSGGGGCRQFWKAGDFEGINADENCASSSSSVGMDHVRVHPKFLHSNATSHKWALGALAELLDNSLDEVCNGATYVNVDMLKNEKDGLKMLLVEDDGGGMTPDRMRQCMSLGYSAKSRQANTIGQYGNGFKTSTMRLGADVIVFSRCPGNTNDASRQTQTIGMLSYSFLRGTGKEDIVVPMIDYEKSDQGWKMMARTSADDWNRNLATIIQWSPYSSEADLLQQFNGMKEHGTRVVIYNLWEDDEEQLELDFDADPHDIQIRGANRDERNIQMAQRYPNSRHYLTYRHSLRSYASILYLRLPPSFRIILRGKDIEHHNLVNDMMLTKQMTYRPQILEGIRANDLSNVYADVTIGFVKDAHYHIDVQGFNVYHKNRLIKPFWRVWNAAGSSGRGVIGVLEANFVEPAHDKQGFERTTVLSRLEARLVAMQKGYWSSNCQKVGYAGSASGGSKAKSKKPNNNKQLLPAMTNHEISRVASECKFQPQNHTGSVEGPMEATQQPATVQLLNDLNKFQPQNHSGLVQRPMEATQQPVTVRLLNDLNSERQRRISLETNLRSAEQKIQELDRDQLTLVDLFALEKSQREEEEKRLQMKLTEAYKTIDDLLEKVRQLEAKNVLSVKDEK